MRALMIIGSIVIVFVFVLIIFLAKYGLFANVEVIEKEIGPFVMAYEKHIGDYKNVGPVMDKIYYNLKDKFNIETTKGFGLYYDNPKEVKKEKLRSIVGCIIEDKAIEELSEISNEMKLNVFPLSKAVVSRFPYKGKLSIILGLFKVYPKLIPYVQEKNYSQKPIMELYDQPNKEILYIMPIAVDDEVLNSYLD